MNGIKPSLAVFLGDQQIAEIQLSVDQLWWNYTAAWQKQGFALSPHLPLSNEIPPLNVLRFLRNLLPEGHGLDELLAKFQLDRQNTFALTLAVGQETAGALTILPIGTRPATTAQFRALSDLELTGRLDAQQSMGLTIWDEKTRRSAAGAQDKLSVIMDPVRGMGFGDGTLCSTHILKFEQPELPYLVLNEYVTMQLASACGLTVAKVERRIIGNHSTLLVTRFDRHPEWPEKVSRRHLIDGCQALNLPPEDKYEHNFGSRREGASLPSLFAFADVCSNPAATRMAMLKWVIFNLLIGNVDAHGKNISFFVSKTGISLAPFYDLVNIALLPGLEQKLAMALGDEFNISAIRAYQLADFADSCKLPRSLVTRQLKQVAGRLLDQLVNLSVNYATSIEETNYLLRYQQVVEAQCHHLLNEAGVIFFPLAPAPSAPAGSLSHRLDQAPA